MPLFASYRDFIRLEMKVDETLHLLRSINERTKHMPTASEVAAQANALLAKVSANTDATASIATFIQGLKDQLAAIQQQLADAIAANDPAALQAASDALAAAGAALDADTVAEQALVNTPAEPTP